MCERVSFYIESASRRKRAKERRRATNKKRRNLQDTNARSTEMYKKKSEEEEEKTCNSNENITKLIKTAARKKINVLSRIHRYTRRLYVSKNYVLACSRVHVPIYIILMGKGIARTSGDTLPHHVYVYR